MAWKKPLAHQTGVMTSILGMRATVRLQAQTPANPAKIMSWGFILSPRKPQIIWPRP